jgi:hypothetical protein
MGEASCEGFLAFANNSSTVGFSSFFERGNAISPLKMLFFSSPF